MRYSGCMKKRIFFLLSFILLYLVGSAFISLANDLQDGLYSHDAGEYDSAKQLLLPLAEQGNALAQLVIGSMYELGKGVQQDYSEAAKWYKLSAEQGNAGAQNLLGLFFEKD